jgi:hypothetical protein
MFRGKGSHIEMGGSSMSPGSEEQFLRKQKKGLNHMKSTAEKANVER